MQLLMDTMLSSCAMVSGALTYDSGAAMTPGLSSPQSYSRFYPSTMPSIPGPRWSEQRRFVSTPASYRSR